jgi:hypothetical protein
VIGSPFFLKRDVDARSSSCTNALARPNAVGLLELAISAWPMPEPPASLNSAGTCGAVGAIGTPGAARDRPVVEGSWLAKPVNLLWLNGSVESL